MADFLNDDFEFKPLTDGLGFHKKIIDLKENPETFPNQAKQQIMPQVKPQSALKKPALKQPPPQVRGQSVSNDLWNPSLKTKDIIESSVAPIATSWPAAIFDSTMVLGLLLIFSAIIFAITSIDFSQLLEMLKTEEAAQVGALVLLISIYEIYTVTCRTFFGKTVGESVFECQLGDKVEQNRMIYPLQVAWRSLAIAMTGFIVLPLLSTLIKQDLAGILSGVSLYADRRK